MIKKLLTLLIILLSHICHSHPTITEYYDVNEVNKLSLAELQRSRFELALQSNLQINEYGLFDFSHPLNGRAIRICGVLLPRDVEVYMRILSSPILHNPPYNLSFGNDDRLMRHLGFVKSVVKLSQSGAAYNLIKKILKNHVSSLSLVKDYYKPKQTWPTYLDNRAAYTNLWKHATNLFTVKLQTDRKTYYSIEGEIHVFKYHIAFDHTKFQELALLLGYWNFEKVSIPEYLVREFEDELNNFNRYNYPKDFFSKPDDIDEELQLKPVQKNNHISNHTLNNGDFPSLDEFQRDLKAQTYTEIHEPDGGPRRYRTYDLGYDGYFNTDEGDVFFDDEAQAPGDSSVLNDPPYSILPSPDEPDSDSEYSDTFAILEWVGGLSWEEAMLVESRRAARVLIKILYKATRNMMKSHDIDVGLIQRDRLVLYKTAFYSYWVKKLRNVINNLRLLETRFDEVPLDEEVEEILFESGSKYKVYWNLKNDSLYNRRVVSDKTSQDIDQELLELLLFEPGKFYNKLINISGDAINFEQIHAILIAITQDVTPYSPKALFRSHNINAYLDYDYKNRLLISDLNESVSRSVDGTLNRAIEQYNSLPSKVSTLLKGRAKCLMAFLYLFGVTDSKGVVSFPNGWPRDIKKSLSLLINGISSPCGLCNTLLGFLASIGFPPVSNNIYAWESRKNDEETTVYQLISGNLYNSFLKRDKKGKNDSKPSAKPERPEGADASHNASDSSTTDEAAQSLQDKIASVAKSLKFLDKQTLEGKFSKLKKSMNKADPNRLESPLLQSSGVLDRSGYDLPLLCYLSGSYKNDEMSSLAYSYYIHSGIGNSSRTCQKSAQSSINRSPKNVGMMCLDAIPYVIESAKLSMKNKHDNVHDSSEEYKSRRYAEFIKKLSHMGDSDGLRMMGDFYYTGHEEGGIRRNYQQALNFWSRAAESGDASSALAIAHHHLSNMATDESGHSAMQAERYLRMVLNSSTPTSSSFSTANFYLYRHGLGQPRDAAIAARYLRESADRGDVNSMVLMGHAYAGILTDVSPPEGRNIFMSFYYYRRAAQSGNIVGLFNSAVFTLHGYDLEYTNALDRCNEAYKLFSRVARMGTMATVLRVLSKRAKRNNDKIGHTLMNMMLSELGDANAHRELTKHFRSNSVFCYTQNLDPDITSPSTLYSSKNMSNSNNPITFKKFQTFQNLQKSVPLESIETYAEAGPHASTLGNMGANTSLTPNMTNVSSVSYPERPEVHRMSREIRMLNMVRVTEQPDDPDPDLGHVGMWTREESQNVSIFDSLIKANRAFKEAEPQESQPSRPTDLAKSDSDASVSPKNAAQMSEGSGAPDQQAAAESQDAPEHSHAPPETPGEPVVERASEGSCYFYYSRRGAYSPQNSTPLLLAEALLSGRPWLPSEALFWAKRSKEADSLKGSYMYATMLEAGIGAPKNCQVAFGIFKNFMSSKSRGERILGLACILRNRIVSRLRRPAFLHSFLVRLMYDSYACSALLSKGYTPCNFEFLELGSLPTFGLHILSLLYLLMVIFALLVYLRIFST